MSEVKINKFEKDDCTEMIVFLENLSPELKERFKTIMWWGEEMEREQTTIRLPAELKKKLQQEADKIGISFNEIVIKLLNEGLNSYSVISN